MLDADHKRASGGAKPQARPSMKSLANWRVANLALTIVFFDQLTKLLTVRLLNVGEHKVIVSGFFHFVHWNNTGAAWSIFSGNNSLLAVVAVVALIVLFCTRHHFDLHTIGGQVALGLIFGGIIGNLIDRIRAGHVIDMLYFYVIRRNGTEAGFPAFNLADSAIFSGVCLLFLLSWQNDRTGRPSKELLSD
jgi:signal peptidase II